LTHGQAVIHKADIAYQINMGRTIRLAAAIKALIMKSKRSASDVPRHNQCFEHTSNDNGMALSLFFTCHPIIQGQVDWIIQEVTKMQVRQVTETVAIEKNTANVIAPLWDRPPAKTRSLRCTYGIADAPLAGRHFLGIFCNVAHSLAHEEITSVWRDNDLGPHDENPSHCYLRKR